jgi:hypothetical protein
MISILCQLQSGYSSRSRRFWIQFGGIIPLNSGFLLELYKNLSSSLDGQPSHGIIYPVALALERREC